MSYPSTEELAEAGEAHTTRVARIDHMTARYQREVDRHAKQFAVAEKNSACARRIWHDNNLARARQHMRSMCERCR